MPIDRAQTARGALAGALAAAIWAAQSPLDARVFGVDHHDPELLGKTITRGPAWRPLGWAMHVANGAAFGAVYANVASRLPGPAVARGPLAGLVEHLATWPLAAVVDRYHPAREELPRLAGSTRAFAQSAWRHLLFGAILGEIERHLNRPSAPSGRSLDQIASSNGHGELEHAVGVTPG